MEATDIIVRLKEIHTKILMYCDTFVFIASHINTGNFLQLLPHALFLRNIQP